MIGYSENSTVYRSIYTDRILIIFETFCVYLEFLRCLYDIHKNQDAAQISFERIESITTLDYFDFSSNFVNKFQEIKDVKKGYGWVDPRSFNLRRRRPSIKIRGCRPTEL